MINYVDYDKRYIEQEKEIYGKELTAEQHKRMAKRLNLLKYTPISILMLFFFLKARVFNTLKNQ
jgi:hypothetical protein